MARSIDMGLSRRIDTWVGLVLCALLYAAARLRARLDRKSTRLNSSH